MPLTRIHTTASSLALSLAFSASAIAEGPDFNREVRPILSNYCFKCHGPDDKSRKAELRFDIRENALGKAESGAHAVVPGKPEASEAITRIFSTDPDELMPPPSMKKELNDAQRDILKRWIAAGADYQPHWAFAKPRRAATPTIAECGVRNAEWKNATGGFGDWGANPIDGFILKKLGAAGLMPSPEAAPEALIRRMTLDLIGLPPTPEEVDAFVQSAARNPQSAAVQLTDRLLASPQYGERWARRWLDLARYADSNGYEKDRTRNIWPYRDWVVRALNADMPFDQFTIEQIAGDMLPDAKSEQRIATGFHRNTMLNEEGGIDPLEFRFQAVVDRVATTGATWIGLTVGCAQCHTHKYDPIQHREYYQLMAFLNNADEPDLDLPPPDAAKQIAERQERAQRLLKDLADKWPTKDGKAAKQKPAEATAAEPDERPIAERRQEIVGQKFTEWLARERGRTVKWTPLMPASAKSNLPLLTVQPDASVFGSGDISKSDTYELAFAKLPRAITAIRLEAMADERLPAHGPGMTYYEGPKGDFFMGEFKVAADGKPVIFSRATESYAKNNFGSNPASAMAATDGDPQTGWSCAGRMGETHEAVFIPEHPIDAAKLDVKMLFGRHYACPLGRFRISVTTDTREAEAREMNDDIEALLLIPDAQLTDVQRGTLREHFLITAPELAKAAKEIRDLRKPPEWQTTLVLRERPAENPRPTAIHNRGEFTQPTEPVHAGVFAFLNPLPATAKPDRLSLARWLVSPENPLTARVAVNRAWAAFFGHGLVKTTEDFGFQGDPPTHPELLDTLAVEFMAQGWSMKKLHRRIVTSATYRQASNVTPEHLAKDPENKLLAHFPRKRIEAEIVRDAILRASGLLSLKMGGPPVKPPQVEGVSEVAYSSPKWDVSTGEDRYRRSIYTFVKRTAPFAFYNTFDGPTGEQCIARRDVSNTPLQALTLLNDVVSIEAAQALGKLLAARAGSDDDRITEVYRRLLSRSPRADELPPLRAFLAAQRKRFTAGELDAKALGGTDANAERAAWTALARALLNLDETVTKG